MKLINWKNQWRQYEQQIAKCIDGYYIRYS